MNSKARELLAAVSAVLAATLVVACWHHLNRTFPNGDEAEYMWASLGMYRRFVQEGLSSGLHGLYELRLWKPILHPALLVPALFLAGGRVLTAQAIGALYLYSTLALAVYAVSRRFLSRVDSVIVSALLLNLQWMMLPAHAVKSELSFVTFFFATWAFLLWSDGFSKFLPTISGAVCLGLSACIRPAESAVLFAIMIPPFFFFSRSSVDRSKGELRKAAATAAICIVPFASVLIFYHRIWGDRQSDWLLTLTAAGLAVSWLLYAQFFRRGTKSWIQPFILISATIVELWFAPNTQSLLGWIGFTSFESGPHQMPQRVGFPLLFSRLAENYFGVGSVVLVLVAVALSLLAKAKKSNRTIPSLVGYLVVLLLALGLHITLGARSFNQDIRYYLVEIASLYFLLFVFLLQDTRLNWLKRPLLIGTWVVLVMSQLGVYGVAQNPAGHFIRFQHAFGRMGADSPWRTEEAGLEVFDQVAKRLDPRVHSSLLVYPVNRPDGFPRFMEPFTMKLIALSKGYSIDAAFPHPGLFEDWKTWHAREGNQYDYYLVGPIDNESTSALPREIREGGNNDIFSFSMAVPKFKDPLTFYWVSTHRVRGVDGPSHPSPSLWLRADGRVITDKNGKVIQWTDEGSTGIPFYKSPDERFGATLTHAGPLSKAAIHFVDDKDRLVGPGTAGDLLFGSDEASLFVVLRQDGRQQNNDAFAWGDCQENRFMAYLGISDGLMFQMGDPHKGQFAGRKPPDWNDRLHILSFIRKGSALRLSVDGTTLPLETLTETPPKANNRQVFPVGIAGLCGEGFKGDISEIILFKEGLEPKLDHEIQQYLSKKYGITLH